jgi:hypothetical protein
MASAVRQGLVLHGAAAPLPVPRRIAKVSSAVDQTQDDESDFAEEWPDTVYMHHPLPELYADWQEFVVDSQGATTEDGKQMKGMLRLNLVYRDIFTGFLFQIFSPLTFLAFTAFSCHRAVAGLQGKMESRSQRSVAHNRL